MVFVYRLLRKLKNYELFVLECSYLPGWALEKFSKKTSSFIKNMDFFVDRIRYKS